MFLCIIIIMMLYLTLFILAIEDEYNGPVLENGKVTENFMKKLLETYKGQGKLHKKYAYQVCNCSSFVSTHWL